MSIFAELTLLVGIATIVAFLMRALGQPLVIGYIITGLLGGPLLLDLVNSQDTLALFSEIGIAFLLFIVGLNLTPKTIQNFGKVSLVTGLGQVLFTFLVGWFLSSILGFSLISSAYLSIGLAFSSTIIILKLLSDKGDTEKLYGKISIGFLLVQDFLAILILFLIPLLNQKSQSLTITVLTLAIGFSLLAFVYLVTHFILPKLHRFLEQSQELLFLFAIAWGLGLAALFRGYGFSLESGALIAGISLSTLPSHDEIHARLKPLRDFFIILFFVLLGAEMAVGITPNILIPALTLSLFVLIGNPLILMIIMGILGYRKKTSFQTGLTVAQISEFSLIVVAMGVKFNHIPSEILSTITLVGVITIFISTYLIMKSDKLYAWLSPLLFIFEKKNPHEKIPKQKAWQLILFGQNRIGYDFLNVFRNSKLNYLVVDYNPETIQTLGQNKIDTAYGDAGDIEFLRLLNLKNIKMAVSSIPDFETNKLILEEIRRVNKSAIILTVAHSIADALALYEKGVNYVIMPHFLGGKAASQIVSDMQFSKSKFAELKNQHIKYLLNRASFGHEHPRRQP